MSAIDELRAAEAGLPLGVSNPDPPLACFPLKCEFPIAPESVDYPAPLHTSDDPPPALIPGPIKDLAFLAMAAGWQSKVTYARGHVPHAKLGTPSVKAKEIWAVRLMRGEQRAVAVREDGSWQSFWVWSKQRFHSKIKLLADFQRELGGEW